jgi:tetratricopeptide (TPR) repeat protein
MSGGEWRAQLIYTFYNCANSFRAVTLLLLLIAISLTATAGSSPTALDLYQRALVQENAAGNLPEAIRLYQEAAKEAGNDRDLAAHALIRAARSYEKLGQPQAADLYAEVMRTYPEQHDEVALAQSRLAVLRRSSPRTVQTAVRSGHTDISAVFNPLFETYCMACHSQNHKSAGLALDTLNTVNVSENTAVWEKIVARLKARRDPPLGMRRPDDAVYQSAISTAELALDQAYPVNSSLNADRASDADLAARIARFIWNSNPDAALLETVQKGTLRNPGVLEQQVRRMLRDPKANSLATNFFERWMLRDSLDRAQSIDDTLRRALETETRLFLQNQIQDDHNAIDLWTANYTFINDRLARHYGISGITGTEFRRYAFADNTRAGILGQGSFLTAWSEGKRTSPVERGKMILTLFFGIGPPDPPPNVPPIKSDDNRPMRVRMEEHHTNPACNSCHMIFEPLGMALENFNPIGQWRNTDGGAAIEASGAFVDGTRFNGPAELRADLLKYRDAYYSNVVQKLLSYALKRGGDRPAWNVYDYEMPSVRTIVREAGANDYRWSSIVLGIVKSTPFQAKTVVP